MKEDGDSHFLSCTLAPQWPDISFQFASYEGTLSRGNHSSHL